jgi:hypothetical protein
LRYIEVSFTRIVSLRHPEVVAHSLGAQAAAVPEQAALFGVGVLHMPALHVSTVHETPSEQWEASVHWTQVGVPLVSHTGAEALQPAS